MKPIVLAILLAAPFFSAGKYISSEYHIWSNYLDINRNFYNSFEELSKTIQLKPETKVEFVLEEGVNAWLNFMYVAGSLHSIWRFIDADEASHIANRDLQTSVVRGDRCDPSKDWDVCVQYDLKMNLQKIIQK